MIKAVNFRNPGMTKAADFYNLATGRKGLAGLAETIVGSGLANKEPDGSGFEETVESILEMLSGRDGWEGVVATPAEIAKLRKLVLG